MLLTRAVYQATDDKIHGRLQDTYSNANGRLYVCLADDGRSTGVIGIRRLSEASMEIRKKTRGTKASANISLI